MKISESQLKVNPEKELIASYDVSMEEIHFYSDRTLNGKTLLMEDVVSNTCEGIKNHFLELEDYTREKGLGAIHVFFEPTGGYERILKTMALKRGYKVSYVSGEATKKASVIENNENGKSDKKDKRVINLLAKMSKTLTCRDLPESYALLRQLGEYYEDESLSGMIIRNKISKIVKSVFPGLNFKCKFTYSATGKPLVEHYGFNPHKITKDSLNTFIKIMKGYVPKCRMKTLNEIYRKAGRAIKVISAKESLVHDEQLKWLYSEYANTLHRKENLKSKMLEIYKVLPEYAKLSVLKEISNFQTARIIGETGPLNDFKTSSQVIKYAGLNIKIKEVVNIKEKIKSARKGGHYYEKYSTRQFLYLL
jgi:transposase